MEINQGDVFWFDAGGEPRGSAPAYSPTDKIIEKKKIEYELDNLGSWTKATKFELVAEGGKVFYKPVTIINRKITYFDTK